MTPDLISIDKSVYTSFQLDLMNAYKEAEADHNEIVTYVDRRSAEYYPKTEFSHIRREVTIGRYRSEECAHGHYWGKYKSWSQSALDETMRKISLFTCVSHKTVSAAQSLEIFKLLKMPPRVVYMKFLEEDLKLRDMVLLVMNYLLPSHDEEIAIRNRSDVNNNVLTTLIAHSSDTSNKTDRAKTTHIHCTRAIANPLEELRIQFIIQNLKEQPAV